MKAFAIAKACKERNAIRILNCVDGWQHCLAHKGRIRLGCHTQKKSKFKLESLKKPSFKNLYFVKALVLSIEKGKVPTY
jgi:hypothetical protein